MTKNIINMLSSATSVKGQGVGSAYLEQVKLVSEGLSDNYEVVINKPVRADITHFHTIDFKFFLGKDFVSKTGKSVGYVHMLPETVEKSLQLPYPIKSIFFKYLIQFYKRMDYLVTVNPYFIGELEKYGISRDKVTYIPNFVSSDLFYPLKNEAIAQIKEKYNIPKDKFVVLSAGQLQRRKGIFDVVEMAKKLPNIHFVWAGGFSFGKISDGYKEIEEIVAQPPQNMTFLGIVERDDMNVIYNMADVMMLASFEELFPMTILEAMCVHKPILLRDLDIYPNILFDFYVKANDIEEFIQQITKLYENKEFYAHAVNASKKGNAFYSKENVLAMWQSFYDMVLKSE